MIEAQKYLLNERQKLLQLKEVAITYADGFTAVKNIDFFLREGEIVALLGASGSGKSTLLRGIAGLEEVTEGAMEIYDSMADSWEDLRKIPVHKRNIGMVFQDGQLFPHRSVAKNISYGLEMHGVAKAEIKTRVSQLLELVDLADYGARSVQTLSGGQAQRVALARSLAPKPRVLLLDEPLSALDKQLRKTLALDLRKIIKHSGTSAIFVTHDEEEAAIVSDRVIHLSQGQILETEN